MTNIVMSEDRIAALLCQSVTLTEHQLLLQTKMVETQYGHSKNLLYVRLLTFTPLVFERMSHVV